MSAKPRQIGRDPACELVLDAPGISRLHATLRRDAEHHLWLEDAGSANGTHLNRNRQWLRVERATLCVGDRVRFGEVEVPLDRLAALFGGDGEVRLRPLRLPSIAQLNRVGADAIEPAEGRRLLRNPLTGAIEEAPE